MSFKDEPPEDSQNEKLKFITKLSAGINKIRFLGKRLDIEQALVKYSNPDHDLSKFQKAKTRLRSAHGGTTGLFKLPDCAPLVYQYFDPANTEAHAEKRKGITVIQNGKSAGKWVHGYFERKAQVEYETGREDSPMTVPPSYREPLISPFNAPDHPATTKSLVEWLTNGRLSSEALRESMGLGRIRCRETRNRRRDSSDVEETSGDRLTEKLNDQSEQRESSEDRTKYSVGIKTDTKPVRKDVLYPVIPPKNWSAKWPLGLDLLSKAFRYDSRQRILQSFLDVITETDSDTFEQKLLFVCGIDTIDPENIKAVLSDQSKGTHTSFYGISTSGFDLQPFILFWGVGYSPRTVQSGNTRVTFYGPNFQQIRSAVDKLVKAIPDGEEVDLQPLFSPDNADDSFLIIWEAFDIDNIERPHKARIRVWTRIQSWAGLSCSMRPARRLILALGGKKFRDACKICHHFVDSAVHKALDSSRNKEPCSSDKESYNFIEALIEETTDPKILRDQCINILLAGRDTTACCLTWALRLLVLHPRVMAKLRSEFKETFGVAPQENIDLARRLHAEHVNIRNLN
ncbi:n-alkane-inducible cytochrome P450 [Penicillium malachiteum]|uniref:N-alkane-inducible cytochrome P450 n=1 Tax=Penicillium malachiteum TaxID=1324776 RepID=A0AAD6HJ00_9EURO|nr:n-alkane-inducible cytochrome P450 [Penicillium malachiteum]